MTIYHIELSYKSYNHDTAADCDLSFAKQIPYISWAKHCLVMASSTLEINQLNTGKELHSLQASGYFICSQATSINALDSYKGIKK